MTTHMGHNARLYLGGRDASGDVRSFDPKFSAGTADATTYADGGYKSFEAGGLTEWSATLDLLFDGVSGGIAEQLSDLAASFPASLYLAETPTDGTPGLLLPANVLSERSQPVTVGEIVKIAATLTGSGKRGTNGVCLQPLATFTTAGAGSTVDGGASSANGGIAILHVTDVTGSGTIKIQHSTNGTVWTDKASFTATATAGAEAITLAGTINRYVRAYHTPGTSITFVAGLARF